MKRTIEEVRAYDRERGKLPHRRAQLAALAANVPPKVRRANVAVGNAVRDGKLTKQPCFICGAVKVEAHHADYDAPLSVVWLCRSHHIQLHRQHCFSQQGAEA